MYSLIKYRNGGIAVCFSKRISTTCRGTTILKPSGRFLVDRLHSHENAEILQQMKKQIEGKSCIVLESRTKNKALEKKFIENEHETNSEKNVKKNTENHTIHDNRLEDDECHSSLNGLSNMGHSSTINAEYNGRKENEKHTICDTRLNDDECQFSFDDLTNMPHSSPLNTETADEIPKTSNDSNDGVVKYLHLQEQVRENKKALPDNSDDELLKELKQWNIKKRILNISSSGNLSAESELEEREGTKCWSAEERDALRQYFSNYYKLTQKNKVNTYPCCWEMNKAIEVIPLLKNKTQALIRSKLQNVFAHLLQKFKGHKGSDEEEEEILSDSSESAEELDELLSDQSW